jgi:membrane fusion protein (multidrug efflux system)
MKNLWQVVGVIVIAGIGAMSAIGLRHAAVGASKSASSAGSASAGPPEVGVVPAKVDTISSTVELAGSVEPVRMARLASPAEGPIEWLVVREGDRVKPRQVLARVGRAAGSAARLRSAREELHKAELEMQRVDRLAAKGAVAGELLDRARADWERAKAVVAAEAEAAGDHVIVAPFGGVISRVLVDQGNFVAPRTLLLEMFDPAQLVVRVAIPESLCAGVSEGSTARLRLDAFQGVERDATVTRLFPELDRKTRTRTAELGLPDTTGVTPGMFARVRITLEESKDSIVLPAAAVVTSKEGNKVVFVVTQGQAHARQIETGIESGERVQIRSGVSAGEDVVVSGQGKIKDLAAVKAKRASPPSGSDKPKSVAQEQKP